MAGSSVRLQRRFDLARTEVLARLARVVTKTGEDIAEATRTFMVPGNFFYSGLSRDGAETGPAPAAEKARAAAAAGDQVGTAWEQLGPLRGQVHVRTPWAAYPEFGTVHMAPRPALTPAIAQEWPAAAYRHAREEDL